MSSISAMRSIALCGAAFFYCQGGFELTEAGLYLNWMVSSYVYSWSASRFGFMYHSFYYFLDGNIELRLAFNLTLSYLLVFLLSALARSSLSSRSLPAEVRWILASAIAYGALAQSNFLNIIPTYRNLNFQVQLIALVGVLLIYIEEAKYRANVAGLKPGKGLIDLLAMSPTLQPWTIGGYPGGGELARAFMAQFNCGRLASAWLLVESAGPRSISAEALHTFGASLGEGYQAVVSWFAPVNAGGSSGQTRQTLYKPSLSSQVRDQYTNLRKGPGA